MINKKIKFFVLFLIQCILFTACEKKEVKQEKQEASGIVYESIILTEEQIEKMNMNEFLLGSWYVNKRAEGKSNKKEVWINSSVPRFNEIWTFKDTHEFSHEYIDNDYAYTGTWSASDKKDLDNEYKLYIGIKNPDYYDEYDEYETSTWKVEVKDHDNIIINTRHTVYYYTRTDSQIIKILNDDNVIGLEGYLKSDNSLEEKVFNDYTLLIYAVIFNKAKIAAFLIEQGEDLSLRNYYNYNVFEYAVMYSDYENGILKMILEKGIDVNNVNERNWQTALDFTLVDKPNENTKKIQKLLVEYGAVCSRPEWQRDIDNAVYLIKLFSEYKSWNTCITFSPDGKTIISGNDNGNINIWDALSGKNVDVFGGHAEWVRSLSYSHDGKYILSGSFDDTVKIWDAHTYKEIRIIKAYANDADSAGFSPDGKFVVSTDNRDIVLFNASTGREVRRFKEHKVWGAVVTFSPDGKLIASGGKDENKLWETDTGKLIWTVPGHNRTASSITFSHDGSMIASAGEDNKIMLFESASGKLIRELPNGSNWTNFVRFTRNGKYLVSASTGGSLKFWEVSTGELIKEIKGFYDEVFCFSFNPDENQLITSSRDGHIKLWDVSWLKNYSNKKPRADDSRSGEK